MTFLRPRLLSFLVKWAAPQFSLLCIPSPSNKRQSAILDEPILPTHRAVVISMESETDPIGETFLKQLAMPTHNCGWRKLADNVSKHHLGGAQTLTKRRRFCLPYPNNLYISQLEVLCALPAFIYSVLCTGQLREFSRAARPRQPLLLSRLHRQNLPWQQTRETLQSPKIIFSGEIVTH